MSAPLDILKKLLQLRNEARLRTIQTDAYREAMRAVEGPQPTQLEWLEGLAQPMRQGVYRGYAGDNSAMTAEGPLFIANQRPMADMFAQRRAMQTGQDPHVEMFLLNPATKAPQYRIHPPEADNMSRVRKVDPRVLSGRTELYARGGLAQLKECSCHKN